MEIKNCKICPRECNCIRDNEKGMGFCKMPSLPKISRYSIHMWEEPCISGTNGSGTIFFSGCTLKCVYCQNYDISHDNIGKIISKQELVNVFYELIEKGAHNINLVNPTHYVHIIKEILTENKFNVPIIYNSSGYEKVETLKELEGLIDVYLPDLKYYFEDISIKYSNAPNYFKIATKAILEMCRQVKNNIYDENGLIQKGVIVRHLILPNNTKNSIEVLQWCKDNLPKWAEISVMSQYVPVGKTNEFNEINRKINKIEYNKIEKYVLENIENGYVQDISSASNTFIPNFK